MLAVAVCVCVCGRVVAAQRAGSGIGYREAPAVNIRRQGTVAGVEVPLNKIGHRAWTYLGIPYARPPVGDLRFAPPKVDPPPSWNNVRNGSVHMPGCISDPPARPHPVNRLFTSMSGSSVDRIRMSEDCLYLNVYRPEGKRNRVRVCTIFRIELSSQTFRNESSSRFFERVPNARVCAH
jgi:hypothetical protein